jgi:hypothetical protein
MDAANCASLLHMHVVTIRLKAAAGKFPDARLATDGGSLARASVSGLRKPLETQFLLNRIDEGSHLFDRRSTEVRSGGDIGVSHHAHLLRHRRLSTSDSVPEGMPSDLGQLEFRRRRTDVVLEDHIRRAGRL